MDFNVGRREIDAHQKITHINRANHLITAAASAVDRQTSDDLSKSIRIFSVYLICFHSFLLRHLIPIVLHGRSRCLFILTLFGSPSLSLFSRS